MLAVLIAGTASDDLISITTTSSALIVTLNGTETSFELSTVDRLDVASDAGNDVIELRSAGAFPVNLDGGAGDDQFVVGGGNWRANIQNEVTLRGGLGSDVAEIDNTLSPSTAVAVTNPFNIDTQLSSQDAGTIFIDAGTPDSAVEKIELRMGNESDEVDVSGISSLTSLRVWTNGGDDAVLVANDFDSTIAGMLVLEGGAGQDLLFLNDSADAFADAYIFDGSAADPTFRKDSTSAMLIYRDFSTFQLVAGTAGSFPNSQSFRVSNLPAGLDLIIDAGTGDDSLSVGNAATDLATIQSTIYFNGQAGFDRLDVFDPIGTNPSVYSVSSSMLEITGQLPIHFSSLQFLNVRANSGDNVMEVLDTIAPTSVTLDGGAGNDTFRVGNGDIDSTLGNGVSVTGGLGVDSLILDDTLDDVGNDIYTFTAGILNRAQRGVLWSNTGSTTTEYVELLGSANADTVRISTANAEVRLRINTGAGDDTIFADRTSSDTSAATPVTIVSGEGNDSLSVNSDSTGTDAIVAVDAALESLAQLEVRAGGRLNLFGTGDGVLQVGSITVQGTLDVNDQTLLVSGGNFDQLNALAATGYNDGAWTTLTQPALVSTIASQTSVADALGVVRADALSLPVFGGVPTLAGDVIIRYTLAGDANLDRVVGFDDLLVLAQNYDSGAGGRSWNEGNFNYNTPDTVAGAVGFDDLLLLAQTYGRKLAMKNKAR
jgi:hypothetical protein